MSEIDTLLQNSRQKPTNRDRSNVSQEEHRQSRQQQHALLHTEAMQSVASPSMEVKSLQSQIENLCRALQEKEVEAKRLKQVLRYFQKKANMKRSLYPDLESQLLTAKDELVAAKKLLEEQSDVAIGLKYEVLQRDQEIQCCKKENERLLRRVVALEIDLDTHEIHFTEHTKRQMQLEEAALDGCFGERKTVEVQEIEEQYGSRIEDLIAKQFTDYSALEDRYKRDRADSTQKITELQAALLDSEASVAVLENRIAEGKSVKFSLKPSSNVYRERINFVERSNERLAATNKRLMERLDNLESRISQPSRLVQQANVIDGTKITSDDSDERLRESQAQIAFLKNENEFKEKKIALLRVEAITYQLRNLPPHDYNEYLTSDKTGGGGVDQGYTIGEGRTDQFAFDYPHEQLQALREILVRKDRELVELHQLSKAREESLSVQLDAACSIGGMKELGPIQFFL